MGSLVETERLLKLRRTRTREYKSPGPLRKPASKDCRQACTIGGVMTGQGQETKSHLPAGKMKRNLPSRDDTRTNERDLERNRGTGFDKTKKKTEPAGNTRKQVCS